MFLFSHSDRVITVDEIYQYRLGASLSGLRFSSWLNMCFRVGLFDDLPPAPKYFQTGQLLHFKVDFSKERGGGGLYPSCVKVRALKIFERLS